MKRIMLIFVLSFICLPLRVYASEFGDFDPVYYAQKYPEVAQALMNDPYCLYSHYIDIGSRNGYYRNLDEELSDLDTYIDIDLENQLVTLYEKGAAVLETACVSGDVSKKRETPAGTYQILSMVKGKRLKGPTWDVWVDYWMQFTEDSIGLHDASWRSRFGGDIYKTSGSHGCVNIKKSDAKSIYEHVSVGTMVMVH